MQGPIRIGFGVAVVLMSFFYRVYIVLNASNLVIQWVLADHQRLGNFQTFVVFTFQLRYVKKDTTGQ